MKKWQNHLVSAAMLFLMISLSNCISSQTVSALSLEINKERLLDNVPPLENRTLRIAEDLNGFEYQYWICKQKILAFCTKKELKVERWEFSDKEKIKTLKDMGFVLVVRAKI